MHEPSPNDCGCCADVHFGALLNQSARVIRRALDARISGVNPDLPVCGAWCLATSSAPTATGGMSTSAILNSGSTFAVPAAHRPFAGHGAGRFHHPLRRREGRPLETACSPPTRAAPVMRKLKPASHSLKATCRRALTRSRPPSPALCWNKPCATRSTSWKREIPTKRGEISLVKNTRT